MRETPPFPRLFPFIGVLLLTLLDSCQYVSVNWRNQPEPDRSILTGIPCAPPCWQGITPHVTSETEALNILHTNPITKNATLDEDLTSHYSSPELTLKLFYLGWDDVDLYTRNNVVELIRIKPRIQLTLSQLVARYGSPEKFWARGYPADKPDWGFDVSFFYPKVGFVADLHAAPRKNDYGKFIVAEDMQVNNLYYFPAGTIEDVFKMQYYAGTVTGGITIQQLQDWKGFGPIQEVPSSHSP